jgi:hypothetical protein
MSELRKLDIREQNPQELLKPDDFVSYKTDYKYSELTPVRGRV